jgi:hypothetical protein
MARARHWSEMTVEEKLESLKHDEQLRQRDAAAMAKALDQLCRRIEDLERRFEEMPFS